MRFSLLLLCLTLHAETHQIRATKYYNSFDARNPVLARIKPGDIVQTKTLDSAGYDDKAQKVAEPGNPLTGPFYIEGVEPGDTISVTFQRMRLNRNYGYTAYRLGLFSLTPESAEGLYSRTFKKGAVIPERDNIVKWDIDLQKNMTRLHDPHSSVHKMEFPTNPMLGCVGVAAAGVFGPTSGISGNYGGNMDYNRINEGSTVHLPAFHNGGLLFIGDGHALQGDGESTGTGIETSLDITFVVQVKKKANQPNPRVEDKDYIMAVGSQPEFVTSLDRSIRVATSDMVEWLVKDYKMEPWAAHLLIGYQGRYDVVTVAGSMALRIPKASLPAARN